MKLALIDENYRAAALEQQNAAWNENISGWLCLQHERTYGRLHKHVISICLIFYTRALRTLSSKTWIYNCISQQRDGIDNWNQPTCWACNRWSSMFSTMDTDDWRPRVFRTHSIDLVLPVYYPIQVLAHLLPGKMAAISQTISSHAFS